ncbi:hypothetical protein [Thermaerobacillus caldiproteolyticus]|uniref:hypothetical protein n=1 Tax=Thermaerobacillus caldiproteolyticus TaxID=247480 RepID=UPI00188B8F65|nr:hypothetical protein [Anoxybacillus caldiproteolyticus]QPA33404.1 hypothetical protein ISX45_18955 [Anoxybacillus caldiproteolyticus]
MKGIDFQKASRKQLEVIIFFDDCPRTLKEQAYKELRNRIASQKVERMYGKEKSCS